MQIRVRVGDVEIEYQEDVEPVDPAYKSLPYTGARVGGEKDKQDRLLEAVRELVGIAAAAHERQFASDDRR